jgi:hypothetical protein
MTNREPALPSPDEYLPYYGKYIVRIPPGEALASLDRQIGGTLAFLRSIPEERAGYRYEPGKWSLKEVVGHLSDVERIMTYRALRFARNDRTPIPGFEPDDYIPPSGFDGRTLEDLAEEFGNVRRATLSFFRGLDDAAWQRRGEASGAEVSVRALAYIIAGHELHHMEIVRTKYL